MLNTILRQPMAILGALGFISLLSGVAKIHEDMRFLIEAFQTMTHPIWEYTLGPVVRWLGLPFPWWAKDYLTMGLIVGAALFRAFWTFTSVFGAQLGQRPDTRVLMANGFEFSVVNGIAWPFALAAMLYMRVRLRSSNEEFKRYSELPITAMPAIRAYTRIFFEFLLWATLLLAVNYGLFIHDAMK